MIGIFDSGSGGLTVLSELRKRAPQADVVYFGDLKNAPYGNKSREELGALTVLGVQRLIEAGATEIVSACNSVSVSITFPMFEIFEIPPANIIEMVGPTIHSFKGREASVLVLATQATTDSKVYTDGFSMLGIPAEGVAIPELVSLIESGAPKTALLRVIQKALQGYTGKPYTHVVLGCTHYPLIRDLFEEALSSFSMTALVVDPAVPVAESAATRFNIRGTGSVSYITSTESSIFTQFIDELGLPPA
jgi:glutamate racemase